MGKDSRIRKGKQIGPDSCFPRREGQNRLAFNKIEARGLLKGEEKRLRRSQGPLDDKREDAVEKGGK